MKKIAAYFFIITFFFSLSLKAFIFESSEFSSIENHVGQGTLVVFDIDNTVMTTTGYLGGQAWVNYMLDKIMKKGFDFGDAVGIVAALQFLIYSQVDMIPVEDAIPLVIKRLQDKNIHVMALTSRTLAIEERTVQQLHSIGIDFSQNIFHKDKMPLGITSLALYSGGIIFCTGNDKGEILFQFLDNIGFAPSKIVFVDDTLKHVQNVEKAAAKRNVNFVGMHYTKLSGKYSNIAPNVFEQELHEFKEKIGWAPLPSKS